jgi:taurine dioxygenase
MPISVHRLSGSIGAEIKGVDVAQMDDTGFRAVHQALLDHGVILFRDQRITPDQQVAFARRWGNIHTHPYLRSLHDRPEIIEIVKEPEDRANFGDSWHTDQIFTPTPAMATMLYARVMPAAGGDTLFADLYSAYETLSPGMQALATKLDTWNIYEKSKPRASKMSVKVEQEKEPVPAIHPLVRVHPETGRPALYVNDIGTQRRFDGMTEEESRPLLEFFLAHATRPEFTFRLRWQVGTLAIWDNRRLLHMALNDYHGHRRVMHRITIEGDKTIAMRGAGNRRAA